MAGPAAFIAAWVVGGVQAGSAYSPIEDPISRLAAEGAGTRALMTAGMVAFGLALPAHAAVLRREVGGWAWVTAAGTGLATLAVAATPLDRSAAIDTWHGVAAGVGYATLALTPLLAAAPLRRLGATRLAAAGVVAGTVSMVALALTATSLPTGLFQRVGLTATDVWVMATGVAMASGRLGGPAPRS